jgi:hypothetical protein
MATADAVARIHTDCLLSFFPGARCWTVRQWYLWWLLALTAITAFTMWFSTPGPLMLLSAVIGFVGTTTFSVLLYALNHRWLPRRINPALCPQHWALAGLVVAGFAYAALAIAYLWVRFCV